MPPVRVDQSPRFIRFLEWLEAHDGSWQRRLDLFALDVGIPEKALRKIIARAKELKVIETKAHAAPMVGVGRLPNEYRLLISVAQWRENGPRIVAEHNERRSRAARNRSGGGGRSQRAIDNAAVLELPPAPPAPKAVVGLSLSEQDTLDAWAFMGGG